MSALFRFELVSPERLLLAEDVEHVVVPGSEGDFGVLAGHAPFVATLRAGVLEVRSGGDVTQRVFVRGGFAEVDPNGLTVLAQQAVDVASLKPQELDAQIKDLEEDLAFAKTDEARGQVTRALEQLRALQAAAAGR